MEDLVVRSSSAATTLVLVDLDGTLLDSGDDVADAAVSALREVGVDGPPRAVFKSRTGEAVDSLFREVQDHAVRSRVIVRFRSRLAEIAGSPEQVLPGVAEGLGRMRASGVAIAVATNKPSVLASTVLRRSGLLGLVDHVQGSDGMPPKPDPAILRASASVLGMSAGWIIGDTAIDIEAGRRAGVRTLAVPSGPCGTAELAAARPDVLASDFASAVEVVLDGSRF